MLKGTIEVFHKNLTYDVKGIDYSYAINLILSTNNDKGIKYMVEEEDIEDMPEDALWSRGLQVGSAKITVQTAVKEVEGKKVKAPINVDFFCRLGALLRYTKRECSTRNMKEELKIIDSSDNVTFTPDVEYMIPNPDGDVPLGSVVLSYGNIKAMNIKSPYFSIILTSVEDSEIIPKITDGIQKGIAFNKDYLGFQTIEEANKPVSFVVEDEMYKTLDDVIKAHPEKELEWLRDKNYQIVKDDNLQEICDYIYKEGDFVYYDTETSGLNITFKSRTGDADQCVGIILSVKDGESFFFPMQMRRVKNLCNGDHFFFMEHYMRKILENKKLVAHNGTFDWKVSYIYDINANIVADTMTLFIMTLGQEHRDLPLSLKDLAKMFLHRDSLELSDLVVSNEWGEGSIRFWDLTEELTKYYACADTDNTRGIFKYAVENNLLNKYNANKIYEIEVAFSLATAYQEFYGHHIDINNVSSMRKEIGEEMDQLYAKMKEMIGHDFNPNSSPQLKKIMYEDYGMPVQINKKTNKPTTGGDALKYLAGLKDADGNTRYPFCELLMKYKENEGVRKIVDNFPNFMTQDGYIFSSVHQYGTTTGRVSISDTNYQSYNNPVKKNVTPRPGFYMFDTDYSSVEYRVLGNMARNKMIKESFYDPDFDYHTYQAARMYGVPYASVTKKLRKAAKGINFGLPYGMGDRSLGETVFGVASDENTRAAAALRKAYFKGQEDIKDFFEGHRDKGVQLGYTETYFGRRRYYDKTKFNVAAIRRQAGNAVIQGSAADIYKLAVSRVFKRICREGWLGKVLLDGFIHDELLGEVSVEIDPMQFLKVLREEFEVKITDTDGSPWCPLYMGFGWGTSWYQAKSVEVPIKLQWEFVEKYGDTGYPEWDGDCKKFADSIPDKIREFSIRDSAKQIVSEEMQNKVIKPALNSEILDIIKEDKPLYDEYFKTHDTVAEEDKKILHIESPMYREGAIVRELPTTSETQEALDIFCAIHGVDRHQVRLLNIEDASESNEQANLNLADLEDEDTETQETAQAVEEMITDRVDVCGMYVDVYNNKVYLKLIEGPILGFIKELSTDEQIGYNIEFMDIANKKRYTTTKYIPSDKIQIIQQAYLGQK